MSEPHEIKHLKDLESISGECSLFLKRNNTFPISPIKEVALYGNGARRTVKGGTGSGNVLIRTFVSIEDAFKQAGIEVLTTDWMDKYNEYRASAKEAFVKQVKKEAREHKTLAAAYSIGKTMPEPEYEIPLDKRGDLAIYVLSRNAGEGQDRRAIKGDYYLTDTEVRDILLLNKLYPKFLLVLNVASVIDITPVIKVDNILLLGQLGSLTSQTLVGIIKGDINPSGKLATTWAKLEDYPSYKNFGELDETRYEEGIYVGYRYFASFNKKVIYPFGYGLSYSEFKIESKDFKQNKDSLDISVKITNSSKFAGKEVVQLYVKKPCDLLDNPVKTLVNFQKTGTIEPGQSEVVTINLPISQLASFDEGKSAYILSHGIYELLLGNSSENLEVIASIEVPDDLLVKKVKEELVNLPFISLKGPEYKTEKQKKHFLFKNLDFNPGETKYVWYREEDNELIDKLSIRDLAYLSCGDIKGDIKTLIGEACSTVTGGAGESTLQVKDIKECISMCDGPAGIRFCTAYIESKGKKYPVAVDPLWIEMHHYLPPFLVNMFDPSQRNKKRKGDLHEQYTTAIPVATALAQSFNMDVISKCGDIIREEMEIFNVDVWLAPAMNIIRNVLCGRNFEYFSEDPYLTGKCAAAITNAIQKNPRKGAVVKHYAANNQEFNRTQNDSVVSIRALREIYLAGFEIAVKEASPYGVMASYNLVNGIHASESKFLISDVLRSEWGYQGLVMTDWITTGRVLYKKSRKPYARASRNLLAGTNMNMPGGKLDIKDILKAYKKGLISEELLRINANIVYNNIMKLKHK